jgi:uncharacterized protein YcgI (DUF1989 family)
MSVRPLLERIEPGGRIGFEIDPGMRLTITQPDGEQVADLVSFNRDDLRERLSMQQSRVTQLTYKFVAGHHLNSNITRKMWEIERDDTGENYCGGGYCSSHVNEVRYGRPDLPSCEDNLVAVIKPYGLDRFSFDPDAVFNIFMTVGYDPDGTWEIRPPKGKPGDAMVMRATMPMLVAISNCPMTLNPVNNCVLKPLDIEVS